MSPIPIQKGHLSTCGTREDATDEGADATMLVHACTEVSPSRLLISHELSLFSIQASQPVQKKFMKSEENFYLAITQEQIYFRVEFRASSQEFDPLNTLRVPLW